MDPIDLSVLQPVALDPQMPLKHLVKEIRVADRSNDSPVTAQRRSDRKTARAVGGAYAGIGRGTGNQEWAYSGRA